MSASAQTDAYVAYANQVRQRLPGAPQRPGPLAPGAAQAPGGVQAPAAAQAPVHAWPMAGQPLSAALGATLGAAVGDAAGGVLEFFQGPITVASVDQALTFPGGGHWHLRRGQITDDTELAIALADSLATSGGVLDLDSIWRKYELWWSSNPFDYGSTMEYVLTRAKTAKDAMIAAAKYNASGTYRKEANGSLMRATPLGVWASRMSSYDAFCAGYYDALMTHPGVAAANGAYVCAVAYLVGHHSEPGRAAAAIQAAMACVERCDKEMADPSCASAMAWLKEAAGTTRLGFGLPNAIGHARFAFTHAFRHLGAQTAYDPALRAVLLGGGDTDTNAAIVGGMLGALHGIRGIPALWLDAVLACDARVTNVVYSALRLKRLTEDIADARPGTFTVRSEETNAYIKLRNEAHKISRYISQVTIP
jgi:ADP-ribosyl-[dinitrogen reductase] hydrolase